MGFLGLFTKTSEDSFIVWLNKVDKAYETAFCTKNAKELERYMTRGCLLKQMDRIRASEKAYSGLSRYVHTDWKLEEKNNEMVCYVKQVTYDQIKMSHGIVAAVGDEYSEKWYITGNGENRRVSEIRRIN